jgi:hypothetical protein
MLLALWDGAREESEDARGGWSVVCICAGMEEGSAGRSDGSGRGLWNWDCDRERRAGSVKALASNN